MRNPSLEFGASEKQGVYDAIYKRRDVRVVRCRASGWRRGPRG